MRLQKVGAFRSQALKASLAGSYPGPRSHSEPHFQKCLLFSKQFMHQGNVAETTR